MPRVEIDSIQTPKSRKIREKLNRLAKLIADEAGLHRVTQADALNIALEEAIERRKR